MIRMGSGLTAALLATALFGVQSASAQSYLLPDTPQQGVWVEVTHPNMKGEFDVTIPSTAWFLSGRHQLMPRMWGVADLPFAYGRLDATGADGNTVLGNPYVGIEYAAHDRVTLEGGLRLPLTTADDDSFGDVVGYFADPLRGEAFLEDVVPISAAATARHTLPQGISLRARSGITSQIWRGDDDAGETIHFLDYGVFGTYPVQTARLGMGVAGRWDMSADAGSFSDNSLHQLGLSADALVAGRFRPGVSLRIPLDESHREIVGSTVGLYMQVSLR